MFGTFISTGLKHAHKTDIYNPVTGLEIFSKFSGIFPFLKIILDGPHHTRGNNSIQLNISYNVRTQ